MNKVDIISPGAFQFTQPKLHLGQSVKTRNGRTGYIVGLIFYPDTETWSYGIYLPDREGGEFSEVWYERDEITSAPQQRYLYNGK